MATISSVPETLDLEFVIGDEFTFEVDFDANLTGYTFEAKLFLVTSFSANGDPLAKTNVTDFTQVPIDLSQGRINLTLNEVQTGALSLYRVENGVNIANSYRWTLKWVAPGTVTKTVRSGKVTPRMV